MLHRNMIRALTVTALAWTLMVACAFEDTADGTAEHGLTAVPAATAAILDDIPGYASGTVGGSNGTIYTVTNLGDTGPGSLRHGLESPDPLWIVFEDGLNGTIPLESQIHPQSYKTVDARGHQITLAAVRDTSYPDPDDGWHDTGIWIEGVHDIVFLNLTFDGSWPDQDHDDEGADGIHLHNDAHHVWVHHCTFHNWIDGAIDARVNGGGGLPHHISITSSHFYDTRQGLLLEATDLTFARNYCDNVYTRCIKVIGGGRAHAVNNVVKDWDYREIIAARNGSQLLVDHNIFDRGSSDEVGKAGDEGSSNLDGRWQSVHNHEYMGQNVTFRDTDDVDSSFKSEAQNTYGLDRRVDCQNDDCWNDLYDAVIAEAGARSSSTGGGGGGTEGGEGSTGDPCSGVTCSFHGYCASGSCVCDPGYGDGTCSSCAGGWQPNGDMCTPSVTIDGTAGGDALDGLAGSERVRGLDGDDHVRGLDGDDFVNGNQGDDFVNGNQGRDEVHGGQGNDEVHGGAGDDAVFGDVGDDTIYGDSGNDRLTGGEGSDTLMGGEGDDHYTIDGLGIDWISDSSGYDTARCLPGISIVSNTMSGTTRTITLSTGGLLYIGDDAVEQIICD